MKIVFSFTILLFTLTAIAQRPIIVSSEIELGPEKFAELQIKRKQNLLNKIGLIVEAPPKYTLLKEETLPLDMRLGDTQFAYINSDSSALITIAINARDSIDYLREANAITKISPERCGYDPDDQWLFNFRAQADSTEFQPIYYTASKLKKYNATGGVEFKMKRSNVYFDSYKLARAIMLNRKYRGFVNIYYFVKAGASIDLTNVIKNGERILSFK